jgi:hypothetical protein
MASSRNRTGSVDWIDLAQDMDKRLSFVKAVLNILVP